jgi:hypothetical protein
MDAVHEEAVVNETASDVADVLHSMRAAAWRAPSGDNMQPWRFDIGAERLEIYLDEQRDPSPMNSGQRMSLVACGAAAESANIAAHAMGWNTQLTIDEHQDATRRVASVRLIDRPGVPPADFEMDLLHNRVSNRRVYDGRELAGSTLRALERTASPNDGVGIHWVGDRFHIARLASLIARGDAAMFAIAAVRQAFLKNVRFDLPAKAQASEGLPMASLELGAADRIAMSSLRYVPNSVFRMTGGPKIFGSHARKLVGSASGLCLVTVDENIPNPEVAVGRAMLRAWLALTDNGLAAQPMMTLPVLQNTLRLGTPEVIAAANANGASTVLEDFYNEVHSIGIRGQVGFILRFGYAPSPSGRTGRLN